MKQDDCFAGVTEDALDYISTAELYDTRGDMIHLRNKQGKLNIKRCMALLGFCPKYTPSVVLREEKEIKDRIDSVIVRNPLLPYLVEDAKVYTGKLRDNYEPPEELYPYLKNIAFDENVMHVVTDKVKTHIEEIGKDYTS